MLVRPSGRHLVLFLAASALAAGCDSSGAAVGDAEVGTALGRDASIADAGATDATVRNFAAPPLDAAIFVLWDASCLGADGATVDPTFLQGAVPACASGYAHPNVCCHGGPEVATVCLESADDPFRPCVCDTLTFPDPRTCCSLDDGGDCTAVGADAAAAGSCHNPCGPGSFPPDELSWPRPACTDVPTRTTDAGLPIPGQTCFYCCAENISAPGCTGNFGTCIPNPQGGLPICPDQTFGCGLCPDGWSRVAGVPDLCCRVDGGPLVACFSQADGLSGNLRDARGPLVH
jgi:hypothetical protein